MTGAFPSGRSLLPAPEATSLLAVLVKSPRSIFSSLPRDLPALRHVPMEAPYWLAENGDITPRGGFPTVNYRKTALRSGKRQENFNCCRPPLLTVAVTETRKNAKVNKTQGTKNNRTGPRKNTGKH